METKAQTTSLETPIPRPLRWFSWLVLGALSAFFAEVSGASSPLIFFDFFGLMVTIPLYTLHLLVLAPLVIRRGYKTTLSALFITGALFGMYEAYITKVLWSPPWNPEAWRIGEVAVLETLVLVLFWYPLMAFIVPLFVGDGLLGGQKTLHLTLPLKGKFKLETHWLLVIAGGLAGLIHGATTGNVGLAVLSSISSTAVIMLLVLIWKRMLKRKLGDVQIELVDLLPDKIEWRWLALLLLADYLALGFVLRREAFPGWVGHITVWVLYLILFALFWFTRRAQEQKTHLDVDDTAGPSLVITQVSWLLYSLGFIVLSALSSLLLLWAKDGLYLILWTVAVPVGLFMLARTILYLIKPGGIKL